MNKESCGNLIKLYLDIDKVFLMWDKKWIDKHKKIFEARFFYQSKKVEFSKLMFTKLMSVIRLAKVVSPFKFSHLCTTKVLPDRADWLNSVH